MASKWRNVRIFVSSTFRDMHAERDHLVRVVFPEIKKLCLVKRVHLVDVDLRWGVSEKDAQDGKALDICLNEIDTCRPYFLGLLGHRYGWIPLPPFVEKIYSQRIDPESKAGVLLREAYQSNPDGSRSLLPDSGREQTWSDQWEDYRLALAAALEVAGVPGAGRSITASEIFHGVLHNEVPQQIVDLPGILEGRLEGRRLSEEQIDCLSRNYLWDGEKRKYILNPGLNQADRHIIRSVFQKYAAYQRDRSFFFFRSERLTHELAGSNQEDFFEPNEAMKNRLDALKEEIKSQGLAWFEYDDLESVGKHVRDILWERIQDELGHEQVEERDWLEVERDFHHVFAAGRTRLFVGRRSYLDRMQRFCEEACKGSLMAVRGDPGSGKSALLAQFSEEMQLRYPNWLTVPHFVGASPDSTSLRRLLRRLFGEINRFLELEEDIPEDIRDLLNRFPNKLKQISDKGRVLIIIDAVNQMERSDNPQDMTWLPSSIPENVCFVISSLEGESLTALLARKPEVVDVAGLSDDEVGALVEEFLKEVRKDFPSPEARDAFLVKVKRKVPLYIMVALEELRVFGLFKELPQRINELPADVPALFQQVLGRVEDDFKSFPGLVSDALSLIACSRQGMTPEELQALLAKHAPALSDGSRPDRLPDMLWSRLRLSIDAYLFERSGAVDFFHGQLKKAVGERWLKEKKDRVKYHMAIADYFKKRWAEPYIRALDELPHQQIKTEDWDGLVGTLCDLEFLDQKCRAGMAFGLVDDYNAALAELPEFRVEAEQERQRIDRCKQYGEELILHARDPDTHPLPQPPPAVETNANEDIPESHSARAFRLRHFSNFIFECASSFITFPEHTMDMAVSFAAEGPVVESGREHLEKLNRPWLMHSPCFPAARPLRPQCLRILEGHKFWVTSVSITPDGRHAVSSGSWDKALRVWNLETGRCLKTLQGHTATVQSVSITPDCRRAVSGSDDETLRLWDLQSGQCLRILKGHTHYVQSVSITPDGRRAVSGSDDGTLRLWDLQSGQCLRILKGHTHYYVQSVSITPDGRRAVSGSIDGARSLDSTLRVWNLETGRCLKTLQGHTASVQSVSITPDGRRAVSGSDDGTLRLWDLESGQCIQTLIGHSGSVTSVSITPDGRRAVSGSVVISSSITPDGWEPVRKRDYSILRVWDLESGRCLKTLQGHTATVQSVSITPDGRRAVSGSDDKTLRLWDLQTGLYLQAPQGHSINTTGLCITADGRRAVSGSIDGTLRVWDLASGRCLKTLQGHTATVQSVSITPDGRRAISGSNDKTLRLWDLESGQCIQTLIGHTATVQSVSITPDGRRAVSGSVVISSSITPDGWEPVHKRDDSTLRVWDLESGRSSRILQIESSTVSLTLSLTCLCITPDGRHAVSSGSWDKALRVWNLETGRCLKTLQGHTATVLSVSITPDGRRTVSGSADKTLRVWNLQSGQCLRILEGHTDWVNSVSITPDGRRTVSGSADKTLRVWNLQSGRCLAILPLSSSVSAIAASQHKCAYHTKVGKVGSFALRNFPPNEPVIGTVIRICRKPKLKDFFRTWFCMGVSYKRTSNKSNLAPHSYRTRCPLCAGVLEPSSVIIDTINFFMGKHLKIGQGKAGGWYPPDSAFDDPHLLSDCPHCGSALKFNPFFMDIHENE